MKLKFTILIFILSIFSLMLNSCYKDSLEELNPGYDFSCDSTSVMTYSTHIQPIMNAQCTGCHSGTSPSGNIDLSNYDDVKAIARTGLLYSSITWDGNAVQMPKGSSVKINSCSITQIKKWIEGNYAP